MVLICYHRLIASNAALAVQTETTIIINFAFNKTRVILSKFQHAVVDDSVLIKYACIVNDIQ
jgi:hypothetical protein